MTINPFDNTAIASCADDNKLVLMDISCGLTADCVTNRVDQDASLASVKWDKYNGA